MRLNLMEIDGKLKRGSAKDRLNALQELKSRILAEDDIAELPLNKQEVTSAISGYSWKVSVELMLRQIRSDSSFQDCFTGVTESSQSGKPKSRSAAKFITMAKELRRIIEFCCQCEPKKGEHGYEYILSSSLPILFAEIHETLCVWQQMPELYIVDQLKILSCLLSIGNYQIYLTGQETWSKLVYDIDKIITSGSSESSTSHVSQGPIYYDAVKVFSHLVITRNLLDRKEVKCVYHCIDTIMKRHYSEHRYMSWILPSLLFFVDHVCLDYVELTRKLVSRSLPYLVECLKIKNDDCRINALLLICYCNNIIPLNDETKLLIFNLVLDSIDSFYVGIHWKIFLRYIDSAEEESCYSLAALALKQFASMMNVSDVNVPGSKAIVEKENESPEENMSQSRKIRKTLASRDLVDLLENAKSVSSRVSLIQFICYLSHYNNTGLLNFDKIVKWICEHLKSEEIGQWCYMALGLLSKQPFENREEIKKKILDGLLESCKKTDTIPSEFELYLLLKLCRLGQKQTIRQYIEQKIIDMLSTEPSISFHFVELLNEVNFKTHAFKETVDKSNQLLVECLNSGKISVTNFLRYHAFPIDSETCDFGELEQTYVSYIDKSFEQNLTASKLIYRLELDLNSKLTEKRDLVFRMDTQVLKNLNDLLSKSSVELNSLFELFLCSMQMENHGKLDYRSLFVAIQAQLNRLISSGEFDFINLHLIKFASGLKFPLSTDYFRQTAATAEFNVFILNLLLAFVRIVKTNFDSGKWIENNLSLFSSNCWIKSAEQLMQFFGKVLGFQVQFGLNADANVSKIKSIIVDILFTTYIPSSLLSILFDEVFEIVMDDEIFNELLEHLLETHRYLANDSNLIGYMAQVASKKDNYNLKLTGIDACLSRVPGALKMTAVNWAHISFYLQIFEFMKVENGSYSYILNIIFRNQSCNVWSKIVEIYGECDSFGQVMIVSAALLRHKDLLFRRNMIGYSLFVKNMECLNLMYDSLTSMLGFDSRRTLIMQLLPEIVNCWCSLKAFDEFPFRVINLDRKAFFEHSHAISALIKPLLIKQGDQVDVQNVYEYLKEINAKSCSKFGCFILGNVACMYDHVLENVFRPDQASVLLREKFAEVFGFVLEESLANFISKYDIADIWEQQVESVVKLRLQRLDAYCGGSINFTSLDDKSTRSILSYVVRMAQCSYFRYDIQKLFLVFKIMTNMIDFSQISHITSRMIWNCYSIGAFSLLPDFVICNAKLRFLFKLLASDKVKLQENALLYLLEMAGMYDFESFRDLFIGKFILIEKSSPYHAIIELLFGARNNQDSQKINLIGYINSLNRLLCGFVHENPQALNMIFKEMLRLWADLECISSLDKTNGLHEVASDVLKTLSNYNNVEEFSSCKVNFSKLLSKMSIYFNPIEVETFCRSEEFKKYEKYTGTDISVDEALKSYLISQASTFLGDMDGNIGTIAYEVLSSVFYDGGNQTFAKLLDGSIQQYLLPIFEESSIVNQSRRESYSLPSGDALPDPRKSLKEFCRVLSAKLVGIKTKYKDFQPFLKLVWSSPRFSKWCFPFILGLCCPDELVSSLQLMMNNFDSHTWNADISKLCNLAFFCVRYFSKDQLSKSGHRFIGKLNFLKLSNICSQASDFHSALLYLELCCGNDECEIQLLRKHLIELVRKHKKNKEDLAYRLTEIPDTSSKTELSLSYGSFVGDLENTPRHVHALVQSLIKNSMHNLLSYQMLSNVEPEILSEIAWRNSQWDLESTTNDEIGPGGINQLLLLCGRNSSNLYHSWEIVGNDGFCSEDSNLAGCLSLLEVDYCADFTKFEAMISCRNQFMGNNLNFTVHEPVLSFRIALLRKQLNSEMNYSKLAILKQNLLSLSSSARKHVNIQLALNSCELLKTLTQKYDSSSCVVAEFEHAKCLWSLGESLPAIGQLKSLIFRFESEKPIASTWYVSKSSICETKSVNDVYSYVLAKLYSKLGVWVGSLRSETHEAVESFFRKALTCLKHDVNVAPKLAGRTYWRLAQFSDQQYLNIKKSSSYKAICELNDKQQATMEQIESNLNNLSSRSDKNAIQQMKKKLYAQFLIDHTEFERFKEQLNHHSELAVNYYLKALATFEKHDDCVYRLISIWFENLSVDSLNQAVTKLLPTVPSHKFLSLMHQLSAKYCVSSSEPRFAINLLKLLAKICIEHPHHSLFQIFALKNAQYKTGASAASIMKDERFKSSIEIIRLVSQSSDLNQALIMEMDKFCDTYNEFAYFDAKLHKEKHPKTNSLPLDGLKIRQLGNMQFLHIPTVELEIQKDGNYSKHIVVLKSIGREYLLVGGINLPKRIKILGSNNRVYMQLVKGHDDLRQDAVLQQVFSLVNEMLKSNGETLRRSISMPVYKVIPLSSRSGIVEWVENCVPIGNWLTNAHKLYHPDDYEASKCREKMRKESEKHTWTPQSKLNLYVDICRHFRPVLRYFFYENFISGEEWFAAKEVYAKTCAVSAILGYILGIGDRHAHNILIDNKTARLVHIDLGIAFEQGKLLSIPETVPFRLTPDIVDGMGLTKTDGTFRKSSELVLELLQKKREILMTVLSVFKHDPLYNWLVTSHILARKSENAGAQKQALQNEQADRALYSVDIKLSSSLSVSCQVNDLIREATDQKSLAMMFHGWQPWM